MSSRLAQMEALHEYFEVNRQNVANLKAEYDAEIQDLCASYYRVIDSVKELPAARLSKDRAIQRLEKDLSIQVNELDEEKRNGVKVLTALTWQGVQEHKDAIERLFYG